MLPLIDYDRAHQRNHWLFITRIPKALHLLPRTQIQEGFIDERAPLNPTTLDPSRTADECEDEDEWDDEMSEPTQTKKAEKRKEFQTDEIAKELRASSPMTDSSHVSSLRPSPLIKRRSSPNDLQNKPEPRRREWRHFKMSHIYSKWCIVNIRETDFFK